MSSIGYGGVRLTNWTCATCGVVVPGGISHFCSQPAPPQTATSVDHGFAYEQVLARIASALERIADRLEAEGETA